MDTITIADLEVRFHVGVPDEERLRAQRLLITVEMDLPLAAAAQGDDLLKTINYYDVSRRILGLGEGRQWKLIETLAEDIAQLVLREFRPQAVRVEVKKFILPDTRHVSVRIERGSRRKPLTAAQVVTSKIGGVPGGLR